MRMIPKIHPRIGAIGLGAAVVIAGAAPPRAEGCPNCGPPRPALVEQIDEADAVVLVRWVSAVKPRERADDETFPAEFPVGESSPAEIGSTSYEIVRVAKADSETIGPGGRIEMVRFRPGKPDDLFLLMGKRGVSLEWETPIEISEAGFAYIENAPAQDVPTRQRLEYYLKYLEFPDPLVAADAFQEFANAPYEDLEPLIDRMPRERLRKWIVDKEIVPTRLNLYGMMLGLCGDEEDEALLKKKILEKSDEMRVEMPGIMSGYLTLAGEEGLRLLEEEKLTPRLVEVKLPDGTTKQADAVPFSETFAAVKAVEFMWDYEKGRVSPERLKQSMRIVLERSDLADFAIQYLSRWKDWKSQDRVIALYDAKGFEAAAIKRAIIGYFLACVRDVPKDATQEPPHVTQAKKHLATLRERDPKLVSDVERFAF